MPISLPFVPIVLTLYVIETVMPQVSHCTQRGVNRVDLPIEASISSEVLKYMDRVKKEKSICLSLLPFYQDQKGACRHDSFLSSSVHRLCLEFLEQISLCSVSSCMSVTIKRTRLSDVLESLLPSCPQEHTLLFLFSSIFLFSSHSEYFQCYSLEFLVHPL